MHEHDPSGQSPRQELIDLLTADFSSSEGEADSYVYEASALSRFLAHTVAADAVDERFHSQECIGLGDQATILLSSAKTTIAFTMFIVEQIRNAYAHQARVDEVISPQNLGLMTDGEGIFDVTRAQAIEAQVLRSHAFDLVKRNMYALGSDDPDLPPLTIKPGLNPSDVSRAVFILDAWTQDYYEKYGEDPFETTREAYSDVATPVEIIDLDENDNLGWLNFIQQLDIIRRQQEPE